MSLDGGKVVGEDAEALLVGEQRGKPWWQGRALSRDLLHGVGKLRGVGRGEDHGRRGALLAAAPESDLGAGRVRVEKIAARGAHVPNSVANLGLARGGGIEILAHS